MLEAVKAAAKAITERNVSFKPGTVTDVTATQDTANVTLDGDQLMLGDGGNDDMPVNGWVPCQILFGSGIQAGDRVMVMFMPPNGAFIVGRYAGDFNPWIVIGGSDPSAPAFAGTWQAQTGAGNPGQPGTYQRPSYRRIGRIVELRGRAMRGSATGVNPDTIFTLPPGYRPLNDLAFSVIVGPIIAFGVLLILTTGAVQSFIPGGSVDAPNGLITLDGVMFSNDQA